MNRGLTIRWRWCGGLGLQLLVGLLVSGCDRLPGKPTAGQVPVEPRQVTNFASLYRDNCAGCHGVDGRGSAAMALANPVYLAVVDDATLRRVIAQGLPGSLMPAFARRSGGFLTETQIDLLVGGIRSRWARPEILKGVTPPPYADSGTADVRQGAAVFGTFCARCHGPGGQGVGAVESIVDASYLALVSDQGLRTTVIAGRPELGHPDWRNCLPGRALTPAQVRDVVAWLVSWRHAAPGPPDVGKP